MTLEEIQASVPGAKLVIDRSGVEGLIFHRPPTLKVQGVLRIGKVNHAVYHPADSAYAGHEPKMFGSVHPGFDLGEPAAQAALTLMFLANKFRRSEMTAGFQSLPGALLQDGRIKMIQRGVKPGDTIFFRLERAELAAGPKSGAFRRDLSARVGIHVLAEGNLIRVAWCSLRGIGLFVRQK